MSDLTELSREELQEKLLRVYSRWYDIDRCEASEEPLFATAEFHEHQTGFALVRKAEMWSADRHEYTYFFSMPELTPEIFEACMEKAKTLGLAKIDPESGHMCSYIAAVFLCDSADPEAVRALKRYRCRKSFQFSLKGWMEIHAAMMERGKDSIVANGDGRNTAKFLKNMLQKKPGKKHKVI
ncbi:MAG: hypothetical protein PUA52_06070 [Lachnospiraceae bacterium]|nr:hypothetical protein [Lachnospiraceae bacterium]